MKARVAAYCDICHRELPLLGNQCRSGDTSVYTFKRSRWRFFPSRLSWGRDGEEEIEVCGDCMTRIKEAAREAAEEREASHASA